jgi:hypothetical protein
MKPNKLKYTALKTLIKSYYSIAAVDNNDEVYFVEVNTRTKMLQLMRESYHYDSNGKNTAIFYTKKDAEDAVSIIKKLYTHFSDICIVKGIPCTDDGKYFFLEE